jgi:hypothetical protein
MGSGVTLVQLVGSQVGVDWLPEVTGARDWLEPTKPPAKPVLPRVEDTVPVTVFMAVPTPDVMLCCAARRPVGANSRPTTNNE